MTIADFIQRQRQKALALPESVRAGVTIALEELREAEPILILDGPAGDDEWISIQQAADIAGASYRTMQRWVRDGRVTVRRVLDRPEILKSSLYAEYQSPGAQDKAARPEG